MAQMLPTSITKKQALELLGTPFNKNRAYNVKLNFEGLFLKSEQYRRLFGTELEHIGNISSLGKDLFYFIKKDTNGLFKIIMDIRQEDLYYEDGVNLNLYPQNYYRYLII